MGIPAEAFTTTIWIAIYFGIALSLPVIIWQAWSFFIPAVDRSHADETRPMCPTRAVAAAP